MIRKTVKDCGAVSDRSCSIYNSELYQSSIVEELYNQTVIAPNGEKCYHRSNDVSLLFNQQRIAALGTDTVNKWLEQLIPVSDALQQLRSKCSDDDLLNICKSRYVQSPSELLAWSDYLNRNYNQILSQIKQEQGVSTGSESNEKSENTSAEAPTE